MHGDSGWNSRKKVIVITLKWLKWPLPSTSRFGAALSRAIVAVRPRPAPLHPFPPPASRVSLFSRSTCSSARLLHHLHHLHHLNQPTPQAAPAPPSPYHPPCLNGKVPSFTSHVKLLSRSTTCLLLCRAKQQHPILVSTLPISPRAAKQLLNLRLFSPGKFVTVHGEMDLRK